MQPQNKTKRGKGKNKDKRSTAKPRVPKKGASEGASELNPHKFQENPKTPGAQNGAPKKRQEAGRTAKKGETTSAAGHKNKKEQEMFVGGGLDSHFVGEERCRSLLASLAIFALFFVGRSGGS